MNQSYYDQDYYEHGIESGKSCYQNYRWVPELTIPMAMTIVDYLGIRKRETVLDYGCAFGYLVKALRLLYRDAWGFDVSKYAISKIDSEIAMFCSPTKVLHKTFDYCIAKDVFEHLNTNQLIQVLLKIKADKLFVVVPLGCGTQYNAPSNNLDKSHILCKNEYWWTSFFNSSSVWKVISFTYKIEGIKDSYYERFPEAHGFYTLVRC